MKDIKTFIAVDSIIFILKLFGGLITRSYALVATGAYDFILLLCTIVVFRGNKDNKKLSTLTILMGVISFIGTLSVIVGTFINEIKITSLWVILFIVITLIMRYIVSCFYTNMSYQRKKGLLSYGNMLSNTDFYNYGIVILALVLMKVSKWVPVFKYADRVATILLSLLLVIKGIKLIKNSIARINDKTMQVSEEVINEIKNRSEIKSLGKLELYYYGGVRVAKCDILLKDNLSMVDVNSFVITLQDYLLKIADAVRIFMIDTEVNTSRRAKVRSLKQDARNSRSRNSKTGTKKKPTKKTNK